jgi:tetratricopeptide (TPR) repeat protein
MDETNARYEPGKAHLRAKEFTEATATFQKLVEADPQDAEAWQFLGAAQSQSKNWAAAVSAFRKAEALESTPRNRYNLAVALSEGLARHEEARLYLERALEKDPTHAPSKELLRRVTALSAPPQYDPARAQKQIQRKSAPLVGRRLVLGILGSVVVTTALAIAWYLLRARTGWGGPLVAYGVGWLVGLLTAKACGRGGETAARIAGTTSAVFFLPLCGYFILLALQSGDTITLLFTVIAGFIVINQAYKIALTTD